MGSTTYICKRGGTACENLTVIETPPIRQPTNGDAVPMSPKPEKPAALKVQ